MDTAKGQSRTGAHGSESASLLLDISTAAQRLSVSQRSIWRWISAGEIRVVKLGRAVRVPVCEVERIARQGVAQ